MSNFFKSSVYLENQYTYCIFMNHNETFENFYCCDFSVKLLSLLNLLCNTTQTTSIQMRDACYGCFFRAGNIINGPTLLSSLNDCARLYISESEYASCALNLQALVDGNRPQTPDPNASGFCFTGYCDFVRCIRRINGQQLVRDIQIKLLFIYSNHFFLYFYRYLHVTQRV